MKIVILGWGSLIWDKDTKKGKEFDHWRETNKWEVAEDLKLPLEFSRISKSRKGALTLVIDEENRNECCVLYSLSKRKYYKDAVCDLRRREGTVWKNIGYWSADGNCSNHKSVHYIKDWAKRRGFGAVVWTALESNFKETKGRKFTVENAIQHLEGLSPKGKLEAKEYIWRAPKEIKTRLRTRLKAEKWF